MFCFPYPLDVPWLLPELPCPVTSPLGVIQISLIITNNNSVALVRERTLATERPPLVD
jgi:hypothetical protein